MNRPTILLATCLAAAVLAGCSQTVRPGLSFAPVGAGAGGAATGSAAAFVLDAGDQRAVEAATTHALETGRTGTPIPWRNARSGHFGEVTPGPRYRINDYDCRDFTQAIYFDGKTRTTRRTACKQPDGSWQAAS